MKERSVPHPDGSSVERHNLAVVAIATREVRVISPQSGELSKLSCRDMLHISGQDEVDAFGARWGSQRAHVVNEVGLVEVVDEGL